MVLGTSHFVIPWQKRVWICQLASSNSGPNKTVLKLFEPKPLSIRYISQSSQSTIIFVSSLKYVFGHFNYIDLKISLSIRYRYDWRHLWFLQRTRLNIFPWLRLLQWHWGMEPGSTSICQKPHLSVYRTWQKVLSCLQQGMSSWYFTKSKTENWSWIWRFINSWNYSNCLILNLCDYLI